MHIINIFLTFLYCLSHYICKMMQVLGSILVCQLFALSLLSVFALKMSGDISALMSGKILCIVKVCSDPEQEEKKDSDKPSKTFDYLITIENHTTSIALKNKQAAFHIDQSVYRIAHFDSVPSPPPDYNLSK